MKIAKKNCPPLYFYPLASQFQLWPKILFKFNTFCGLACGLVLSLTNLTSAYSTTFTFAYEGVVNLVNVSPIVDATPFNAFLGETLRVEYTFTTVGNPDTNSLSFIGDYAYQSLTATIGMNTYQSTSGRIATINNDVTGPTASRPRDDYIVRSDSLAGPDVSGVPIRGFSLAFSDFPQASVFSDDSLPTSPPDPSAFMGLGSVTSLSLIWESSANTNTFTGIGASNNVQNVSATNAPIPEPSTILLYGTGLAGLAAFRWKKLWPGRRTV